MARASLTISSRNYSSWSLRGWLLCKFAGLDFETVMLPIDDASARAELLLLSPSFLTPCLTYDGIKVWDTLAIAEFLNETLPEAGLLPDRPGRARALPLDLRRDALRLRQSARGPADEPQGQPSGLQGLGRRPVGHRPHRRHLARAAGRLGRAVPVRRARRWPTPCTRRSAPGSSPTTSRSIPSAPPIATASSPAVHARMDRRRDAEPDEVEELDVEFDAI